MHLIYLSGCYISLFLRNRRWILEIHGIITVKPGYLKVSRREKARDGKDGRKETEIEGEEETKRAQRIGCATSCARGALQWFIIVTRNIGIYIGEVPRAGSKWSRQGSIPSIYLNAPTFHRWRVLTTTGPAPCSFLIKLPRFPWTKQRTLRETSHDWLYALHRLY